jgi:formate-dependent nitrite reductase cytochrome c552 subunit
MRCNALFLLVLVPILFSGCGGGGASGSATSSGGVSKLAASQTCMASSCHANSLSPGTGAVIVQEWQASAHNLRNGAGCADCHEPDAGHPQMCSKCHGGGSGAVTINPDQAGKCGKCHGVNFPNDIQMAQAPQHYGYLTATQPSPTVRASYVSGQYVGKCRACHNPHDNTLTDNHREYARSLHGAPDGVAWTAHDFKQYAACIRCHTTTGYIGFVTSGFTPATTGFGAGDPTREMLACNGCHASYDFKNSIRKVPAFTAFYKNFDGTAQAAFPDVGETNLCIPCHSGRDGAQSINAVTDFSNARLVTPHNLAVAGLMYMQIGFTGFTSASAPIGTSTYGKTLSPDNLTTPGGIVGGTSSTHRKFGTPLIHGDSHKPSFFVGGVMDQNGPCVTCHLNAFGLTKRFGSGHSLKIDANAYNQVCTNCHTSENGVPLNADNFRANFIEPQSEAFQDALLLFRRVLLTRYQISADVSAHFYDEALPLVNGKKQPVTDWTRGGRVDGRKLMGACFNLYLLTRDHGAFAHARTYSRRLVYDSIDFLDDGTMNLSTGATAIAESASGTSSTNPVYGLFTKGAKAYDSALTSSGSYSITTPYPGTSEAMLYLINWARSATTQASAGAWAAIERP